MQQIGSELKRTIGIDPVRHPHRTSPGRSDKETKHLFEERLGQTTEDLVRLVDAAPASLLEEEDSVGLAHFWRQIETWASTL